MSRDQQIIEWLCLGSPPISDAERKVAINLTDRKMGRFWFDKLAKKIDEFQAESGVSWTVLEMMIQRLLKGGEGVNYGIEEAVKREATYKTPKG